MDEAAVLERAAAVRLAVFDVDGVFTDGRLYLSESGEEMRAFCVHDGLGIRLLVQAGVEVAILSGRASKSLPARMQELGVQHCLMGRFNKWEAFTELAAPLGISAEESCFVGDDLVDLPLLRRGRLAIAPADAHPLVREVAHWVTRQPGGDGVVRQVCESLLKARGAWQQVMDHYR